jgi:hypothetical protein
MFLPLPQQQALQKNQTLVLEVLEVLELQWKEEKIPRNLS